MIVAGSRKVFYFLECFAEGCDAEFLVNDIPVIRRGDGEGLGKLYHGACNDLLVDGENEITAIARPGPTPTTRLDGHALRRERLALEGVRITCKLVKYLEGMVSGGPDGQVLAAVEWESQDDGQPTWWPLSLSACADLGPMYGRWGWEDAERLTLDDTTRAEVLAVLAELRGSLHGKQLDPFVRLSRPRLDDLSKAYQLRPGEKENEVRRVAELDFGKDWWGMEPLDEAALDLRLCARGRLVDCVSRDGEPALRELPQPPADLRGAWEMKLAKLQGSWQVVR